MEGRVLVDLGAVLLFLVGLRMIVAAARKHEQRHQRRREDPGHERQALPRSTERQIDGAIMASG